MLLLLCIFASWATLITVERQQFKSRIPTMGMVVLFGYSLFSGLGVVVWSLSPESLFGSASASTLDALSRLRLINGLGIISFTFGYVLIRYGFTRSLNLKHIATHPLAEYVNKGTASICIGLIAFCTLCSLYQLHVGAYSRDLDLQSSVIKGNVFSSLILASAVVTRFAGASFILLPSVYKYQNIHCRFAVFGFLLAWQSIAIASGNRSLVFSLPFYLLIGSLIFKKISLRNFLGVIVVFGLIAVPTAEAVRSMRDGKLFNHNAMLRLNFTQLSNQLYGTSNDFFFTLDPASCRHDLSTEVARDPKLGYLAQADSSSLTAETGLWHHVRLYQTCSVMKQEKRGWSDFSDILHLWNPFGNLRHRLFDGQKLVEEKLIEMQIRPGSLSYGTIGLFIDAWDRGGIPGIFKAGAILGLYIGAIEQGILWALSTWGTMGLLSRCLSITLITSWLNNTAMTTTWHLTWEAPKIMILTLLICIVQRCTGRYLSKYHRY